MSVIIGSARSDERGKYLYGLAGDQKQKNSKDMTGEVSMQTFYVHKSGWNIIRPRDRKLAEKIADCMIIACNNPNIGYDQNERLGIIKNKTTSSIPTECDCSSLVRECVIEASGKDPGNFTTGTEKGRLLATGLFDDIGRYVNEYKTPLMVGDILVTTTKGHTVIVVEADKAIYSVLRRNSRGEAVKTLQGLLNMHGANLTIDGEFGPLTEVAVIEFQASHGLTKNGTVGPTTWDKLLN